MKTIRQKIEEKIGTNYEKLFTDYIKKHPRAKRAFYALEETGRCKNNRRIYTGVKIEKTENGFQAYQHRMNVLDATVEFV